jgi:hypothetical protein
MTRQEIAVAVPLASQPLIAAVSGGFDAVKGSGKVTGLQLHPVARFLYF